MNHSEKEFEKSIDAIKKEYSEKVKKLGRYEKYSREGKELRRKKEADLRAAYQAYADWLEEINYEDKLKIIQMRVRAGISELRYTIIHRPTGTKLTKTRKTAGMALSYFFARRKDERHTRGCFSKLLKRAKEAGEKINVNDYMVGGDFYSSLPEFPLAECSLLVEEVRIMEVSNDSFTKIVEEYK